MKIALIYGMIASLISLFFMYLDTKLLDNPKTKITYIKNMILTGFIVGFGIYLIGENKFEKIVSFERAYNNNMIDENMGYNSDKYNYNDISEEILSPNKRPVLI